MQDEQLVNYCKKGSKDALKQIYEKYRNDLLVLSLALLNNAKDAEDVVHDVFASFIRDIKHFTLTGSLRGYLLTCAANRARNINKAKFPKGIDLDPTELIETSLSGPENSMMCNEQLLQLRDAMAQIPYDQREVIMLHFQAGMTFESIAIMQKVPIHTAKSRYRYGIDKLRMFLEHKAE